MKLDPAPRINKPVFLAIDLVLVLVAFGIGYLVDDPFAPVPFVSIVACVGLAAIIGLIPFLIDYAAESADSAQRERERVNEQIARLNAATESLNRAAAQIKSIEEAVQKSARDAETLPYRMQEKVAEFNEAFEARDTSERDALEQEIKDLRQVHGDQLKSIAEKVQKTASELAALEKSARSQLAETSAAIAKLQAGAQDAGKAVADSISKAADDAQKRILAALARAESKPAAPAPAPAKSADPEPVEPAPAPVEPKKAPEPAPDAEPASPSAEVAAAGAPPEVTKISPAAEKIAEPASDPAPEVEPAPKSPSANGTESESTEAPKAKKPRAAKKQKPEDLLIEMSEVQPAAPAEPEAAAAPVSDERGDSSPSKPESSTSSDGATRLLATAYIGIGNKLFIRGDGPGLSWDRGEPMQFVSIGKWGWHTHEPSGPIRCKLYKNDDSAALSGEILLQPGRHTEITALF